jgi:GntR family transcriptional regulator of arabinose operon
MKHNQHKYKHLSDLLRKDILDNVYPAGFKFDTEEQISNKYKLSRQTVRHAVQILEHEGLLRRVRGSGTFINSVTAAPKTKTLGVVSTYISEYVFPSIIRGIEEVAANRGYSYKLSATGNRIDTERRLLMSYIEQPVDGLIIEGTKTAFPNPNISLYEQIIKSGTPIVFINGYYPGLEQHKYVVADDYAGGYAAAEYLINKGHKKISGIFKADDRQGHERYKGFIDAALKRGIEPHDNNIIWFTTETRNLIFSENGKELLNAVNSCSSIICYNDQMAVDVLNVLLDKGIKVPDDIAIISFDNSVYASVSAIKITSMDHPKEALGRAAAGKLINMIEGKAEDSLIMPWSLVERGTT